MTDSTVILPRYDRIEQKKAIIKAINDLKEQKDTFELYKYFLNQAFNFNYEKETELKYSVDFLTQELSRNIQTAIEKINSDTGENFKNKFNLKLLTIDFEKVREELKAITIVDGKISNDKANQDKVKIFSGKLLEHLKETDNLKYALGNEDCDLITNSALEAFDSQYSQVIIDKLKELGFSNLEDTMVITYLSYFIYNYITVNKEINDIAGFYQSSFNYFTYNISNEKLDFSKIQTIYHEFCHALQCNYKDKAGIDENNSFQKEPQAEMFGSICMILENYKLLVKRYNLNELNKELDEEKNKKEGKDEEKIRELESKIKEIKLKIREELIKIISNYTFRLFIVMLHDSDNLYYNPTLFNNIFMKFIDDVVNSNGKIISDDGITEQEAISSDGTINFRTIYEYTAKRALEHYNFLNELIGEEKIKTKIPKKNDKGELVEEEINLGFVDVLNYLKYFYNNNFNYNPSDKNGRLPRLENILEGIKEYLENSLKPIADGDQRIISLISDIDEFLKNKDIDKLLNITNNFSKLIIDLNKESKLNKERFKGQLSHDKVNLAELFDYITNNSKERINLEQYLDNKYNIMPKLIQEIKEISRQIKELSKEEIKTEEDKRKLENLKKEKTEKQKELLRINSINQRFIYQYNLELSTFKREIDTIDFRIQELEKVNNVEGNKIACLKIQIEINKLKQRKLDNFDLIIQEYEKRNKIIKDLINELSEEKSILRAQLESKVERLNKKIEKLKNIQIEDIKKFLSYCKNNKIIFPKVLEFIINNNKKFENLNTAIVNSIEINIDNPKYIDSIIEIIINKNPQNINFIDDIYNKLSDKSKEILKELIKNKINILYNYNRIDSEVFKYCFILGNISADIICNSYIELSPNFSRLTEKSEINKLLNELKLNNKQKERAIYYIKKSILFSCFFSHETKLEKIMQISVDNFSEKTEEDKKELLYKVLADLFYKHLDDIANFDIYNFYSTNFIDNFKKLLRGIDYKTNIEFFGDAEEAVNFYDSILDSLMEILKYEEKDPKKIAEECKKLISETSNNKFIKYIVFNLIEYSPIKKEIKNFLNQNLKNEINKFSDEQLEIRDLEEETRTKTQQDTEKKDKPKTFVEKEMARIHQSNNRGLKDKF